MTPRAPKVVPRALLLAQLLDRRQLRRHCREFALRRGKAALRGESLDGEDEDEDAIAPDEMEAGEEIAPVPPPHSPYRGPKAKPVKAKPGAKKAPNKKPHPQSRPGASRPVKE